jgi:fructuronate reductase/mannitol 2-dehydrogenase
MGRYLFTPDDPRRVVDTLADERTRLVSLTVTGAGYHVDPATGVFDADDEAVTADVADPGSPNSALGLLVEALDVRRRAGRRPFTVLSCDNMPDNGATTRHAVVSFADLRDPRLSRWIDEHCRFPSSMVDRITPKTTDADRERLARQFGVLDRWPVTTEPFSDWVIEDAFCDGRPPLDEVGVRFVSDVRPYALKKTRLLNASHLVLGALGRVAGATTMDELMADPVFRSFTESLMGAEIAPALPRVGSDSATYRRSLLERLSNPRMRDDLARLCRGGSLKLPRHVLPSLLAARAQGRPHPLLTIAVAGVCRQFRGVDDLGRALTLDDPAAARLQPLAVAGGSNPRPLLSATDVFGPLGDDEGFVAELESALEALDRDGVRATLAGALVTDRLVAA